MDGRVAMLSARPSGRAGDLHDALSAALTCGDPIVDRLAYARTSVSFQIEGEDDSVTLLLDRRPPELADSREPAEIDIELTPDQVARFAAGRLPMPAAVATNSVYYRGPVRKYLEVDPILRRLLGGLDDPGNGRWADEEIPPIGDLDPELLPSRRSTCTRPSGARRSSPAST